MKLKLGKIDFLITNWEKNEKSFELLDLKNTFNVQKGFNHVLYIPGSKPVGYISDNEKYWKFEGMWPPSAPKGGTWTSCKRADIEKILERDKFNKDFEKIVK